VCVDSGKRYGKFFCWETWKRLLVADIVFMKMLHHFPRTSQELRSFTCELRSLAFVDKQRWVVFMGFARKGKMPKSTESCFIKLGSLRTMN